MSKEVCAGGGVHEGEREDGGRGEDTYMSGEVEGGRKKGWRMYGGGSREDEAEDGWREEGWKDDMITRTMNVHGRMEDSVRMVK